MEIPHLICLKKTPVTCDGIFYLDHRCLHTEEVAFDWECL